MTRKFLILTALSLSLIVLTALAVRTAAAPNRGVEAGARGPRADERQDRHR